MKEIKLIDFAKFPGGWSLSPYSMYLTMKYSTYENELNILEFGSGEGTNRLVEYLDLNEIKYYYLSVEHDEKYVKTKNVEYIKYSLPSDYTVNHIESVNLNLKKIFDVVIVDGPHGVGRAKWYDKIKNNIRTGTIVLIDDFHHYAEFETELNKVFEYETINIFNIDKRFTPVTVNEGVELIDIASGYHGNKTHKIIKIINVK